MFRPLERFSRHMVIGALCALLLLGLVSAGSRVRAGVPWFQALNKPTKIVCRNFENTVDKVNILWQDKSDSETSYRVERRIGGGTWTEIGNIAADSTQYTDTGLDPAKVYRYRVRTHRSTVNLCGSNCSLAMADALGR
jgi:hypothetical protein